VNLFLGFSVWILRGLNTKYGRAGYYPI
jgi:hypothetical protein